MKRIALCILTCALGLGALPHLAHAQCAGVDCEDSALSSRYKKPRDNARAVSRRTQTTAPRTLQILGGPSSKPGWAGMALDSGLLFTHISLTNPLTGESESVTATGMRVGAAYGIRKNLEVGAMLPSFQVTPDAELGSNPALWIATQARSPVAEIGIRVSITAPIVEGSDLSFSGSLPLTIHMGEAGLLDMSADFLFTAADEFRADFNLPVRMLFQLGPDLYLGPRSGIALPDFDGEFLTIPLGAQLGYTIAPKDNPRKPLLDIGLSFMFPTFATAANDFDEVIPNLWVISLGVNGHLDFDDLGGEE